MKARAWLILSLVSFVILGAGALPAQAAGDKKFVAGRTGLQLGVWGATLTQEGAGHSNKFVPRISAGGAFQLGLQIAEFAFLEYNLTYLAALAQTPGNARSWSPYGLNVGLSWPILPIEVYGGLEKADFSLTSGNITYTGPLYKVGASFYPLQGGDKWKVGVRAEVRKVFADKDQAGLLPVSFTTRAITYFVGLSLLEVGDPK